MSPDRREMRTMAGKQRTKRSTRKHKRKHEQREADRMRAGEWGIRCAHCGHGPHDGKCANCPCTDFDF